MNYKEAIEYLFSNLPMYQRVGRSAYKSTLGNSLALDEYFGHPHRRFRSVHIAGTNGKGSVAHMLAAVLQSAGYKTGLCTSPHMKDFRERIRIDGQMIPKEKVVSFVEMHSAILSRISPSFFEMGIAMTFDHFASENVDIAVVETGLGGRLDSTNIITPLLSVITNIGSDHSQFLGDTPEKIAREKAGIFKPGIPALISERQDETRDVFAKRAEEMGVPLSYAPDLYRVAYSRHTADWKHVMGIERMGEPWMSGLTTDLPGLYQVKNVPAVLAALELLSGSGFTVSPEALRGGMGNVKALTGLRGRWEVIGNEPLTVCDAAHNKEGIIQAMEQVRHTDFRELHMIIGMVSDKDVSGILPLLPRNAHYYFTQAPIPRAMDKEELAAAAIRAGLYGHVCQTPRSALQMARSLADPGDMIFICGSSFVVAEVLPDDLFSR